MGLRCQDFIAWVAQVWSVAFSSPNHDKRQSIACILTRSSRNTCIHINVYRHDVSIENTNQCSRSQVSDWGLKSQDSVFSGAGGSWFNCRVWVAKASSTIIHDKPCRDLGAVWLWAFGPILYSVGIQAPRHLRVTTYTSHSPTHTHIYIYISMQS